MNRTIVFYRTKDGKCPIRDFLDTLPSKAAQKAMLKSIGMII